MSARLRNRHVKQLVTRGAALALLATATTGSAGASGVAVLEETFDDNAADPDWLVFETHPALMNVSETNQRLEFSAGPAQGTNALAGYLSTGFELSLESDFHLSIDWNFAVATAPGGELGIVVALTAGGSPQTGEPDDGVSVQIGVEDLAPYKGFEVFLDGALVNDDFGPLPSTSGTVHLTYDAIADTLTIGASIGDPNAAVVPDIQALSGACRLAVFMAGFTDGSAPAFAGSDAFFDNLLVTAGTVEAPCPADLDCDGTVSTSDLLDMLALWGQQHVPADLDGGGVGTSDLLALLATWGGCP